MPKSWYRINAKASDDAAEVCIYDVIGLWGVSAQQFVQDLAAIDADTINVRINSPGGDAFDGIAIYNALKACKSEVVCIVDGLAASAASVIAMGGDKLLMGKGAYLMIHNAASAAFGEATDLRKTADVVDSLSKSIANIYAAETGLSVDDIVGMMNEETWMDDEDAVEQGFADGSTDDPAEPMDAKNYAGDASRFAASFSNRVPAAVLKLLNGKPAEQKNNSQGGSVTIEQFKQFAKDHPEALVDLTKTIKDEAYTAGIKAERDRFTAINGICVDRPAIAIECFTAGHDLGKTAQAYATDVAKELKDLRAKASVTGAEAAAVGAADGGARKTTTIAPGSKAQFEADWDALSNEEQKKWGKKNNYVGYRLAQAGNVKFRDKEKAA